MKPLPQSNPSAKARRSSSFYRVSPLSAASPSSSSTTTTTTFKKTPSSLTLAASQERHNKNNCGTNTMRYVDIRVAIPADSPFAPENIVGYVKSSLHHHHQQQQLLQQQSQCASPLTVSSNTTTTTAATSTTTSPSFKARSHSPFAFIPIAPKGESSNGHCFHQQSHPTQYGCSSSVRSTPPSSPYGFGGKASPSLSIMSQVTVDTVNSTLDSRSSPAAFSTSPTSYHFHPHHNNSNSGNATPGSTTPTIIHRPRPKTPSTAASNSTTTAASGTNILGRQSPFKEEATAIADLVRKTRIKTELCMHYENGRPCPFGANCTYAHGEEELQMTKLMDLHHAGLIDKDTYRIKPCLTWVMTGSCPFGKRCTAIHDPRIAGTTPSWLPHTETQGNTMATDINVEALHQKRVHEILYNNPFGDKFSIQDEKWSDLYKLICNIDYRRGRDQGWIEATGSSCGKWHTVTSPASTRGGHHHNKPTLLNPLIKLQIALKMRGTTADWQYKYRPQHVIHDELCMVLQKHAFFITPNGQDVQEIALSSYDAERPNHVLVREIAFGPDDDPSVRGVALWFNISEDDVTLCTPQQAKRFRWKRGLKQKDQDNNTNNHDPSNKSKTSVFDTLDHFNMIRPQDKHAFDLATAIMKHRVAVLKNESISDMRERYEGLQILEAQKKALQERFENQLKQWIRWSWPINKGREHVDKTTPVPRVDGLYELPKAENDENQLHSKPSPTERIWKSFVDMHFDKTTTNSVMDDDLIAKGMATQRRLAIFQALACGFPLSSDRRQPHILDSWGRTNSSCASSRLQQERCWKALLLENGQSEVNEWEAVREHFSKSRSTKVLSIIQQ